MDTQTKPSRLIGPEDVKRGDYVTVTHKTYEFILDPCSSIPGRELSPTPVTVMHYDAGRPLKVISVCLPFVLVEDASRALDTLDLRRHRIARVSRRYGRQAFKALKARKKDARSWAF